MVISFQMFLFQMKIEQQKNYFWLSSSDHNNYVVTKTLKAPKLMTGSAVVQPK